MSLLSCRRDFPVTEILWQGFFVAQIRIGDRHVDVEPCLPKDHDYPACLFVTSTIRQNFVDWEGRCFVAGSPIVIFWDKRRQKGYFCFENLPVLFPGPQ